MRHNGVNDRLANLSPEKRALVELRLKKKGLEVPRQQTIPRRATRDLAPLSFAQQRLWFLNQLEPESSVYNEAKAIRFVGPLDVAALQRALDKIVARHEVLRTSFVSVDGNPVQRIADSWIVELPVIDSTGSDTDGDAEVQRLLVETIQRPFDLSHDLKLRALLIRVADGEHVFLTVRHHVASDGWSSGIFWRELAELYEAFSKGKPNPLRDLPIQYADYAVWQRQWLQGEVLETQLCYWKNQLSGVPVLELPTDRPRPSVQTYQGAKQSWVLAKTLSDQLKALSRKEGVTLFMTLLAAFQTLLHRYTGQDDIVVGSPIAGRNRGEVEELIGFFVNTLVLRTDLSGDPTFREAMARVREVCLGAYGHQDLPFEKLVEELHPERNLSHSPLFQVMFVLQNAPSTALKFQGLSVTPVGLDSETAKFDLTLAMYDGAEGLRGSLRYNPDLFDDVTIARMSGHYRTLLEAIVANPDRQLSDLPILTAAEKHQLLVEWNDTQKDYPREKCLHELFEEQVERSPDAAAVIFEDQQLTYRELNARANQLAHHLRKHGVGPEVLVAICLERSSEMLVTLLGILKAGGAYVPLDPDYPKERLAFILEDAKVSMLLTQQRLLECLPEHQTTVIQLDTDCDVIARESEKNPAGGGAPQNLAYVIYTSGSTGKPKGVMIAHQAICNRLLWGQEAYPLTAADRVLQLASFSFDFSVWEFFGPLLVGARLIMTPPGHHLDSAKTIKLIADQKITTVHFVPSVLEVVLEDDGLQACNSLRRVFCGGENLPVKLQERFYSRLDADLYNQYGPTEVCIDATFWKCKQRSFQKSVPIGRPIANTEVYLLDSHLSPVPIGVPGELYIGGYGLARGYLNRSELTAEKFIANPFSNEPGARLYKTGDLARYLANGNIEFVGGLDHQVKIRGFRIELGEIEAVLRQHPSVQQAIVLAREEADRAEIAQDKRLIAYVVPRDSMVTAHGELRDFLRLKLPEYMVPAVFVFLDAIPLTSNGKMDLNALPAPDGTRPELKETFVAPRNPTEETLARVWAKLLGLNQVGIHDNFFDLGGHSLLAVRLFAQIENEFKTRLPLSSLFQRATIEHLASLISQTTPLTSQSLVTIQPQGSKHPFFCVHELFGDVLCYMNLARHLGEDQPFYALQARGLGGAEEPFTDIGAMAAYYIEEIQTVQPQGPYALGGLCIGGLVAFEMAQQLRAKGEAVALVALLDSGVNSKQGRGVWWWSFLRNLPRDFPSWLVGSSQLNRSQWLDLIRLKITRAKARLAVNFRSVPETYSSKLIKEMGDLFQFSEQHRKVARAQYRALRQYKPRAYPGRLTLFRARMQPFFSSHTPDKGWERLAAGGLEIRVVPGNHLGMLQEPHVKILAQQLRMCLDEARTRSC